MEHMEQMRCGYEYIQCLFCVTGREVLVVRALEEKNGLRAVFPQKVKPVFHRDGWRDVNVPLFPGYVFVYAHHPISRDIYARENGILRVLTYGKDDAQGCLVEKDRAFAEMLLQKYGVVGALAAVEEGSHVHITDGILQNYNGRVLKVDRRKRLAKVELELLGDHRGVWLAFQVLQKDQNTDENDSDAR